VDRIRIEDVAQIAQALANAPIPQRVAKLCGEAAGGL
jgi:hypothetical protein